MKWKNPKEELPRQNQLVLVVTNYGNLHLAFYDGHNYGSSPRFIDFDKHSIIGKHSRYVDETVLSWSKISRPKKLEFKEQDLPDCKCIGDCLCPDKFNPPVEIIAKIFEKTEQELNESEMILVRNSCLFINDFDAGLCEQCYKRKLEERTPCKACD